MEDKTTRVALVCFCIALVAIVIIIAMSFSSIAISEIGIYYNSITKAISDKSFDQGIHFIGPSSNFKV
jgi:hypothetical protein